MSAMHACNMPLRILATDFQINVSNLRIFAVNLVFPRIFANVRYNLWKWHFFKDRLGLPLLEYPGRGGEAMAPK